MEEKLENALTEALNDLKQRIEHEGREAKYMYIAGYRKDNGKDYYTVGEVYDALSSRTGELYEEIKEMMKNLIKYLEQNKNK